MACYSAKLDSRTKQHTRFGVSASSGSRDMARTKVAEKKEKKKKKKMNVDNPIKHPLRGSLTIITITRQVLGRPVCDRGAIPRTLIQSSVVRSRLIILINEEINEANWMASNSAKLDRRTKQHAQFGVSASNGSRDMAWTKLRRKKKIKKNNEANWMISNSAKLDSRTKQHTQSGVSTSDGSRDMARTKSWRKKRKKLKKNKIMKRIGW